MTSNISIQNGHRVRDSFEKLKFDEPLTHRDFERRGGSLGLSGSLSG